MNTLLIIAFGIITVYLAATAFLCDGVPCSISNTYYLWGVYFNKRFLFTFVMWLVGILTIICWIGKCAGRYEFLPFLSVSGMMFVGAAAAFKETLTKSVHYTSAGVWAGAATAFFALVGNWQAMVLGLVFGLAGWLINRRQNLTFWAELAVVVMMFIGIYCL